ncbi:restriction endonuclease [Caldimonas tepidiphila]|uniref:restriction endonuclease n=1 Tax=Caldimonas tepidiphila TaxID=2315841 RepID=UPI000E5C4544|nr:restriction endonuclease [Caldimonas tepidiphila]
MKLKMSPNSLFAILLRSPWWASAALAALVAALAGVVLPAEHRALSVFAALPFIVIALVAAVRQLRAPSASRVEETLRSVSAQSWAEFAATMEAALRRDGIEVRRLNTPGADFELGPAGAPTTLVSCRRWKAAATGIEPLRELLAARRDREGARLVYVVLGEVGDKARRHAAEHGIRIMQGQELAQFLCGRPWAKVLAAS